MKKILFAGIAILITIVIALTVGKGEELKAAGPVQPGVSACTTSTVARSSIGHQESSLILATSSQRAFARIQAVTTAAGVATSTPYISFNSGVAATVTSGLALATSTPFIDFGLATDFPYTGSVTGIVLGSGTTTVEVTECRY